MSSSSASALFQPLPVGAVNVQHRVVMAPLTRFRANKDHVHGELAKRYYDQRASTPGTLIHGGFTNVPGIWNDAQIAGWKAVTDTVHAKGSFIFLQLWALGRAAMPAVLELEGRFDLVGASPIPYLPLASYAPGAEAEPLVPRELTIPELKEYVQLYATAAKNAIQAGFDGVELHSANGYLLEQFLQPVTNERTDEYGGSIENRLRFPLEVIDAVVKAVGAERTGVRISPWSTFQGMGTKDPLSTFAAYVERIRDAHPNFAYIHVTESRNLDDLKANGEPSQPRDFLRKIWGDRPYIAAGGFDRATANSTVEKDGGLVAFGRQFISNPDLPLRLKEGIALTPYNRSTFYIPEAAVGYVDYPFANEVTPLKA
ncbi:hypothetical protein F5148DRAFT_1226078 [Russula earlei]|uniref:Uncharacterized protein n=1 Tax=Russula earlei TaxID=71964 RepID=A0ACC0U023_9AGAM|nr:hypothetical protein F5148DRAFT_1226078 [Russula earlei]